MSFICLLVPCSQDSIRYQGLNFFQTLSFFFGGGGGAIYLLKGQSYKSARQGTFKTKTRFDH